MIFDTRPVDLIGMIDPAWIVGVVLAILVVPILLRLGSGLATFERKPLLNVSEMKLHRQIHRMLQREYAGRVSIAPQVCYGEFLRCRSRKRYMRVQARRCDMALVDRDFQVLAVIEYQGLGHYGRSARSARRAREGDRRKRGALRSAGIPLIEVSAKYSVANLEHRLRDILS